MGWRRRLRLEPYCNNVRCRVSCADGGGEAGIGAWVRLSAHSGRAVGLCGSGSSRRLQPTAV
eukprot:scaffold1054_cov116-Isochrysis_galbana.AAC.4